MKAGIAAVALIALSGQIRGQPGKEDPYRKAYRELSKIKGISGLGITTATQVVHEITFGRPGQNNDEVMRAVMKHRYGLGGLKRLRVPSAGLTDVGAREIKGLPQLDFLSLESNSVTDAGLKGLEQLPNLRTLLLNANPVTGTGLKPGEMPSLRQLQLGRCPVTDAGLKAVAGLKNLESLSLSDAPLTDAGLKHLGALKALNTLYLSNVRVTDAGIKELPPLSSLYLSGMHVAGTGLRDFKSLHSLSVAGCPFSDEGLKALAGNKGLHTLNLNGTRVTDDGMKYLAELPVRELDLGNTKVTARGLKALAPLKSLDKLVLGKGQMSDEILRTLSENNMLHTYNLARANFNKRARNDGEITQLFLMGAPVTDASVNVIAGLKSLKLVNIRNTKITNTGVEGLKKALPKLQVLR